MAHSPPLTRFCPKTSLPNRLLLAQSSLAKVSIFALGSLYFGWPTIAVDTHIDRVSNRTKLTMGKDVVRG